MTDDEKPQKEYKSGEKIKVYPTSTQKTILKRWFGTTRWIYNMGLEAIHQGEPINEDHLRKMLITKENYVGNEYNWVLESPDPIRHHSLKELIRAYQSNFAKGEKFEIHFKKKKRKQETISIQKRD